MEPQSSRGENSNALLREQRTLAELGRQALDADDVDALMHDAAVGLAETLDTAYAHVLELSPAEGGFSLREGTGWDEGAVGDTMVPSERDSQAGYTLLSEEPVVVDDLRTEDRFSGNDLLADHDVVSGVTVLVGTPENPWGVLGTFTTEQRAFTEAEAYFVQSVANVLASAIENERAEDELAEIYGRISDAFFALDEEWRFTYLNERANEVINPEGRELVGENVWEAFPEAAKRKFESKYERAMYEQETVSFEEYYPDPLNEWFEVRAFPSETGLSVYFREITDRKERERELQRYERIIDALGDPVYELDTEGRFTYVNQAFVEQSGYSVDELLGEHVSVGLSEEAVARAEAAIADLLADDPTDTASLEYEATTKDGGTLHVENKITLLTDDDGQIQGSVGVLRDITERKRRERQLRESEQRYRTLADSFPNGIVTLFGDDLEYTLARGRAFEYLPVSPDEVEGQTPREAWGADVGETLESAFEAALDGEASEVEVSYVGRDWVVHTVPVTADDGTVFGGVTMAQDITDQKERERALEESERRYRTLVEHFPNGSVGLFDDDLTYTAVGGQLLDTLDMEPEDRIGHSIHELHPADFLEEVEPYFQAALDGEANDFQIEYKGRHLHAHTLPVRNSGGEVYAGMLVVQDITERVTHERELEESEARFRMLAENLEEVVWMATSDVEEWIYVNPTVEDVWGLDRDQLYEEPWSFIDMIHEDDRERVREQFAALPEEDFDEEFRIVRPDGEVRWIHARGTRMEGGGMTRIVGIGQDVTERKEQERELERALDLLERTERIANVGGWEIDPETEDVFWTEYTFELLGVDADEEPPLEDALDMYHEEDQAVVEEAVDEALASGELFDVEVRFLTGDGEVRWLRVQGAPEIADGEVASLRGAVQDVTERREYERKLEESNERLEQFAYAASHDLQEPLRMVSSYLRLIENRYEDALGDDGREFLEFAVDGADRMRDMIEGLLQYSRVDTRGDPFRPVDLDAVFADVRQDLQVKIAEHDAEITTDPLPTVYGDGSQLNQVFQNLLDNAIEYSGDEPPRVHVGAERGGDHWTISVSDEGIGIDPDHQDRVFEVFQSLQGHGEAGSGLGLALVERIVERHGGEIRVDSEPGEGATFSFTLPTNGEDSE